MFRSKVLISLGMLVVTPPVASVLAAAAEDAALEEVIVTAQNREQSVQDVPIAIDVINAEQLRDAGFSDMNDIDQIAPVVQLNQDQGTVKITVRGVGTTSNDEAQDTSVVVNVDGEYINRPNILPVALFDMDRIEVLRGPQGTLYGRNSTGGAINFITRKAGERFGGNASASYGSYNALRLDAGLDVPLGTIGGLRIAGFHDQRDGYIDHPNASDSSDDNESSGGRVSLRLEPTDALKINLSAEYAQREITPATFAYTDLNAAGNGPTGPGCNATGYVQVAPNYAETLCTPSNTNFLAGTDRDEYTAPLFGLGRLGQDTYAIRGRFAYEFSPAATLTYIGGFRSSSGDDDNFLALPVVYRSFSFVSDADSQSHELRLNGEIGGVIYQLGGFLFKEDIYNEVGFFLPIGPNGTFLSYFGRDVSSESTSVFGQVEVPFGVEGLAAVGGLRYTDNKRDAVYRNAAPLDRAARPGAVQCGARPQGLRRSCLSVDAESGQFRGGAHLAARPQLQAERGYPDLRQGRNGLQGRRLRLDRRLQAGDEHRLRSGPEDELRGYRPQHVQPRRLLLRLQGPAGLGAAGYRGRRPDLQRRQGHDLGPGGRDRLRSQRQQHPPRHGQLPERGVQGTVRTVQRNLRRRLRHQRHR
jgi:iron complex outermembrane receptor protein